MTIVESGPTAGEFDVGSVVRSDRVHGSVYTSAEIFARRRGTSLPSPSVSSGSKPSLGP